MWMATVVVAHEMRGPQFYSSARACLWARIREGWYDPDTEDEARCVLEDSNDTEQASWRFLAGRREHEFERVERQALPV